LASAVVGAAGDEVAGAAAGGSEFIPAEGGRPNMVMGAPLENDEVVGLLMEELEYPAEVGVADDTKLMLGGDIKPEAGLEVGC